MTISQWIFHGVEDAEMKKKKQESTMSIIKPLLKAFESVTYKGAMFSRSDTDISKVERRIEELLNRFDNKGGLETVGKALLRDYEILKKVSPETLTIKNLENPTIDLPTIKLNRKGGARRNVRKRDK